MKWLAGAAIGVLGTGLATVMAFSGWLIATPDQGDGGRRGLGIMIVLGCE